MKVALYRDASYHTETNFVMEYRDRGTYSSLIQMSAPVEVELVAFDDAEQRYRDARRARVTAEIAKLSQSVA